MPVNNIEFECGLQSQQNCPQSLTLISQYEIICIQESKLGDADIISIPGYQIFTKNRTQLSRYRSGGIALLVKEEILPFINIIKMTVIFCFGFQFQNVSCQKMRTWSAPSHTSRREGQNTHTLIPISSFKTNLINLD